MNARSRARRHGGKGACRPTTKLLDIHFKRFKSAVRSTDLEDEGLRLEMGRLDPVILSFFRNELITSFAPPQKKASIVKLPKILDNGEMLYP